MVLLRFPYAEWVITADQLAWNEPDPVRMGTENYVDKVAAVTQPATLRVMLEGHRAGLHVDRQNDREDRHRGSTIACSVLVAWSKSDDMETHCGNPGGGLAPVAYRRSGLSGHRLGSSHGRGEPCAGHPHILRTFLAGHT